MRQTAFSVAVQPPNMNLHCRKHGGGGGRAGPWHRALPCAAMYPKPATLTALPCWAWAEAAQAATASSASAQRLQTPRMTRIVPLPRPERLSTAGLGCAVPTTGGTAGASASLRPCCRAQDGKEVQ